MIRDFLFFFIVSIKLLDINPPALSLLSSFGPNIKSLNLSELEANPKAEPRIVAPIGPPGKNNDGSSPSEPPTKDRPAPVTPPAKPLGIAPLNFSPIFLISISFAPFTILLPKISSDKSLNPFATVLIAVWITPFFLPSAFSSLSPPKKESFTESLNFPNMLLISAVNC